MGGKGHYHGGGTSIGPRDKDWFSEGSTKPVASESAPVAARSPREQAEFEAFKKEREKPTATIRFHAKTETAALQDHANTIIAEYQARGFRLTLRELFYQFVARSLIENNLSEYKRLGDVIKKGRRAARRKKQAKGSLAGSQHGHPRHGR